MKQPSAVQAIELGGPGRGTGPGCDQEGGGWGWDPRMTPGWTEIKRRTNKVERGEGEGEGEALGNDGDEDGDGGRGTGWEVNIRRTR